jgi:translation elongation factor TU
MVHFSCLFHCCAVRELLTFYEFPGDTIPIIRGSALAASTGENPKIGKEAILKLMEAVEASIPTPKRELDKPFLMPVEDIFSIAGRGTVVTGRIEQGKLKVGDNLDVVGLTPTQTTTYTGNNLITCFWCVHAGVGCVHVVVLQNLRVCSKLVCESLRTQADDSFFDD